jgi:O-antigen/teichoic acid export membrane protein
MDRELGQTTLGVWDFAWSCVSYFQLSQIGLAQSAMRHIARPRAMRDVEGLRTVASSVIGVSFAVATLVLTLTTVAVWAVPFLIGTHDVEAIATARWVVALLGFGLAFGFLCEVFSGVLTGSHRWDVHNALNAGTQVFIALSMIGTLLVGGGLREVALAHTIGKVLGELTRIFFAYRVCPELRLRPSYWSPDEAKKLLSFGVKTWIGGLAALILIQTNKLVVASQLGPAALALYARPSALMRMVGTLVNKFAFVLVPTASSLQGSGRDQEVRDLMLMGARAGTAIVLPLTLGLAILGGPLLVLWMGPHYDQGLVLTILALTFAPSLSNRPVNGILAGLNLHGFLALTNTIVMVVGVALSVLNVAVLEWGLVGAAVAVGAPRLLISGFVVPGYACRRLGVRLSKFVREAYALPVAISLPFALVLWLSRAAFADRPLPALVCGILLGVPILVPLYWRYLVPPRIRQRASDSVARRLRPATR